MEDLFEPLPGFSHVQSSDQCTMCVREECICRECGGKKGLCPATVHDKCQFGMDKCVAFKEIRRYSNADIDL